MRLIAGQDTEFKASVKMDRPSVNLSLNTTRLAVLEEFPGWDRVGHFIKSIIVENGCKTIGDIGGGRLPRVELDFVKQNNLAYHLFDISQPELDRADNGYHKVLMDVACSDNELSSSKVPRNFDLIFSHMLLEHLHDPLQAHRNFFKMLRPGGLSVHMFPSRNNLPLFVNGLIPEKLSHSLLKKLQPHRDTDGQEGKFEAFYHLCGAPNAKLRALYESTGFKVLQHTSFVGHEYYKRIKPLAMIERALRPFIVSAGLPLITANLLILRKPLSH